MHVTCTDYIQHNEQKMSQMALSCVVVLNYVVTNTPDTCCLVIRVGCCDINHVGPDVPRDFGCCGVAWMLLFSVLKSRNPWEVDRLSAEVFTCVVQFCQYLLALL